MWYVEKFNVALGSWIKIGLNSYSFGWALRVGMRRQLEEYLAQYRLRHVSSGNTIPLNELLRAEIEAFRVKTVQAL